MKKFFILFIISLACFSCAKNKPEVPEELIPKEKMVEIIMDVYIAESRVNNFYLEKDSAENLYAEFEKRVFEKHEVSETTYIESYKYYLDDLKAMDEIYGALVDSLSLRERLIREPEKDKEPKKASEAEELKELNKGINTQKEPVKDK